MHCFVIFITIIDIFLTMSMFFFMLLWNLDFFYFIILLYYIFLIEIFSVYIERIRYFDQDNIQIILKNLFLLKNSIHIIVFFTNDIYFLKA